MAFSIFESTVLNLIGFIPVDTKVRESHNQTNTVANFALEDGAVVSDHIITNPPTLEIEFYLNSQDIPFGSVGLSYGLRAAALYNALVVQLESQTTYTILTRHRLYTNMVFTELPVEHNAPYTGQLLGKCKMQQINFAKLSSATFDPNLFSSNLVSSKAASNILLGSELEDFISTASEVSATEALTTPVIPAPL